MSKLDSNKAFKRFLNDHFNKLRSTGQVVQPTSPYFGEIGSIPLEDIAYSDQIEGKLLALKELFKDFLTVDQLEKYKTIQSPLQYGYRFKMDYVCSFNPFEELQNKFGQRQRKRFNRVVDMDSCILIPDKVFSKVRKVYDYFRENTIQNYDLVKHIGYLRYLVIKQHKGQEMLIIVTRTNEYQDIVNNAANLALELGIESVYWQVNESITDVSEGNTIKIFGKEFIEVETAVGVYQVSPQTFFQNNIYLFEELLSYITDFLKQDGTDLYDLYCGVGIIGAYLASKFSKVIGIDNNPENIRIAKQIKLDNVSFLESDLNKIDVLDITGIKTGQTVVVDPPRTGLQKNGLDIVRKLSPKTLVYISCNPVTQAQDFAELEDMFEIIDIRGFDMFPHTFHIENLMILKNRS